MPALPSGVSVGEFLGVHRRCHGAQARSGARLGGQRGKGAHRAQHHPSGVEGGQSSASGPGGGDKKPRLSSGLSCEL